MKFFQKYSKWIAALIFACVVILIYKTFDNITQILSGFRTVISAMWPFVIAFVIAYILNMPAVKIGKLIQKSKRPFLKKHSYGIGVGISFATAIVIIVILIAAILPAIYENIIEIYNNIPQYIRAVENFVNDLRILRAMKITDGGELDIYSTLYGMVQKIDITQFGKYAAGVANITSGIVRGFIALIASVYMLLDKDRIKESFKGLLRIIWHGDTADGIMHHVKSVNTIFVSYIYSRAICCIVVGVVSGIVLTVLGVKYSLLLAILICLLDMIPYFGSIISCVIAVTVSLITGGFWQAVWVSAALLVIQQLDGNVLAPKVMSESLEIRPLWIVFAVSVGGSLFGFWGMLISVPVVAAIKAIVSEYWDSREGFRYIKEKKEKNEGE